MLGRTISRLCFAAIILLCAAGARGDAPSTINIRGQLLDAQGHALSGLREYRVQFYDAPSGGVPLGLPITGMADVSLEGLFNIEALVPPSALLAPELWYEVAVSSGSTPGPLAGADVFPARAPVASVPFALDAAKAEHVAVSAIGSGTVLDTEFNFLSGVTGEIQGQLNGKANAGALAVHENDVAAHPNISVAHAATADSANHATSADSATSAGDADTVDGSHASAFAISGHNHDTGYWKLGGNAGTAADINYIGTSDNVALEFRVNNARVFRLEPNATSPNLVGGYSGNSITAGIYGATIGGGGASGLINAVTGMWGTIAGGSANRASSICATVGGGSFNTANGGHATVAGGLRNMASGAYATVGGGGQSSASGDFATVGGGCFNSASGDYATVAGGSYNSAAGALSFCAGNRAKTVAAGVGTFVWADSTDADLTGNDPDMFLVRASRGVYLWTNSTCTTGVYVGPGGTGWNPISDRNKKENFAPVEPVEVLDKVVAMPVSTWTLIDGDPTLRYMGPMAQDFYAAFGLGNDDKSINTVNADGVALAAIQGMNQKLEAKVAEQNEKIESLESRIVKLEAFVQQLAGK